MSGADADAAGLRGVEATAEWAALERYQQSGDPADLDVAIAAVERAGPLDGARLGRLGELVLQRAERGPDADGARRAADLLRRAMAELDPDEDWWVWLRGAAAERLAGFLSGDVGLLESSARVLDGMRVRALPDEVLVAVMQDRLRTEVGLIESGRSGTGVGPAPIRGLIADGHRLLDRAEDPEQRGVLAGLLACAEVMAVKADFGPFDGERVRALLPVAEQAHGGPDWAASLDQVRTLLDQYDALIGSGAPTGTAPAQRAEPVPTPSGGPTGGDLLLRAMRLLRDGDLAGAGKMVAQAQGLAGADEPYLRTVAGVLGSLTGDGPMPDVSDIGLVGSGSTSSRDGGGRGGAQPAVLRIAAAMLVAAGTAAQAGRNGDLGGLRAARDELERLIERVPEGNEPLRGRIAGLAANVDAVLARAQVGELEVAARAVRSHRLALRLAGGARTAGGAEVAVALGEMLRLSGTGNLGGVRRLGLDALCSAAPGRQPEWAAQVIGWCAADLGADPDAAWDLVAVLDAARNRELGRTAEPVSLGRVRAALAEVEADALVHLLPGRAVLVTADGSVDVLPAPLLGVPIEELRGWAGQAVLDELLGRLPEAGRRMVVVPFGQLAAVPWDEDSPVRCARSAGLLSDLGR
ncbi:hypothetical protein BJY16_008532 [Actinoplanes octamycinicus]|uniref:Uncharacterized protein n=1 Tax=Actinoplanes octamycinicus TaxID=135948 RepID=A0A7W7H736_9ACTN|nr:hypothetical protein [Actinoplanes octamycinicus]MBB4745073.1 hypothetical protein [Actinoplanes octamycinicus]GIE55659.1 hypothetical protein Aoc01nite_10610 [Actinoplanes octamycinicus]